MVKSVCVPVPSTRGLGQLFRPAHHVSSIANLHWIRDITLGNRNLDVAKAVGRRTDGGEVGLCLAGNRWPRKRRQQCQAQKALFHFKFPCESTVRGTAPLLEIAAPLAPEKIKWADS